MGHSHLSVGGEKILFNIYRMMYAPTQAFQAEILDDDDFSLILQEFEESLKRRKEEEEILSNFEHDLFFRRRGISDRDRKSDGQSR